MEVHEWLGYVTAPTFVPEYTGPKGTARVLSTEWINGTQLCDLPPDLRKNAVMMATQASLVQLLITGFVHSDPHEGNLLYTPDGKIAFLDFGLVDRISPDIMQSFAEGMQGIVAKNWYEVAKALQAVKWTARPCQRNIRPGQFGGPKYVECPFDEFVAALEREVEDDKEAQARFGALAVALRRLSARYLMLTPPYVMLLTRTFVTLEGMAARVDPDFNIWTMALPVTLRRLVSPATGPARDRLRERVLTPNNEIRWDVIEKLLNSSGVASRRASGEETVLSDDSTAQILEGLLGSSDGRTLRRLAYDVDLGKLLRFLRARQGRPWRRRLAAWIASRWESSSPQLRASKTEGSDDSGVSLSQPRPDERLRAKWRRQKKRALRTIFRSHWSRFSFLGRAAASVTVAYLLVRIFAGAAVRILRKQLLSSGTDTPKAP